MIYKLRPYQQDLIDQINAFWYASDRLTCRNKILCQLPTGGGKTIVLSSIVLEATKKGLKCLVLAHREELINQAVEKLEAVTDEPVGVIKSGVVPNYELDVQVGSVQSMGRRLAKCPEFDLIVIDEAHHTTSASYITILNRYPNAKVLGVTATPIRLDGKGFRGIFDELICGVTVTDLIETGSLSSYKYYAGSKSMSVKDVGKQSGDYKVAAVEAANPVDLVANQVIEAYQKHLNGKQAVVFAVSVAHSIAITEYLRVAGIRAHHLDGMTDSAERKSAMDLFRNKEIQILSNCALFDEGLDIPSLEGVILARPTASLSRYLQMVGRGLRVCEGKERAVIVDLADNYDRLGMPDDERVWTLDGIEKPQKAKSIKKRRNPETGEVGDVEIVDTGTEFIEIAGRSTILTPELQYWINTCDKIIQERELKERKAAWCAYRLLESKSQPPMDAWRYLGKKLGYHGGWAKYKFEEWSNTNLPVAV